MRPASDDGGTAPDVSVVAPLYRNADTIRELASRVSAALASAGFRHELILVDDASPDDTGAAAVDLARSDQAVGVLVLGRNTGQHAAALAGIREACGRWVVLMDADLQDPPEAIPILIDTVRAGYDAVFAGRRGRHQAWHRMVTSRGFKLIRYWLGRTPADRGMFMVLSRDLACELCRSSPSRPSLVMMVSLSGRPVTSVPIRRHPRPHGASSYTTMRRIRTAADVLLFTVRWRWLGGGSETSQPAEIVARHGVCRGERGGRRIGDALRPRSEPPGLSRQP